MAFQYARFNIRLQKVMNETNRMLLLTLPSSGAKDIMLKHAEALISA